MVQQLSKLAAEFIQQQRDKHFAEAKPLTAEQRAVFEPFFPREVLTQTRFCAGKIEDPPFYPMVEAMGIGELPTAAESAAITYIDVIIAQTRYTDRLRFHELVHAVQYQQLGVARFADA